MMLNNATSTNGGNNAANNNSKIKQRSIEVKYADLILNRNSSQYVSKSSQISNKMLGSKWLRGSQYKNNSKEN